MGLEEWVANRWVVPHVASRDEVADLLDAVAVDLVTAAATAAPAWRLAIGYTAALPLVIGESAKGTAEYLEHCSRKRHEVTYESVGGVSGEEADELLGVVRELREEVVAWLRRHHPALAG